MGGGGEGEVEGERFVRMEERSPKFDGRRGNVVEISRHRFVWLMGGPDLSEVQAGQCPTPRRQPTTLETLLAVLDSFWPGQSLCDPAVWPVFLSGILMEV